MGKRKNNDNTILKKVVNEQTGEERLISLHKDHKKPTTRREFLGSGLLGFSGTLLAPSILQVITPEWAFGQSTDQCAVTGTKMPAFITLNLGGGAHISGEIMPLGEDRLPLPAYNQLGLGPTNNVFTDNNLGHDLFQQGVRVSGSATADVGVGHFWRGMKLRASQATIDKTSIILSCTASDDDTSNNMQDASGAILAAGLAGDSLPNLGTSNGTGTGVGQQPAIIRPTAPLIVSSFNDILGSLAPGGTLASRLTVQRREKVLRLVNSLSGSQARAVAAAGGATSQMLAKVVECATGKNIENVAFTPEVDPGLDNGVAAVWGINPANKAGAAYAQAAMVYNALKGNASTIGINRGGHDSHGQGRAVQNQQMSGAGELLGRILETAQAMGQPVVINVVSDGSQSCSNENGQPAPFGADFDNDSGTRGLNLLIAFHPTARPKVKNDQFKYQSGYYTNGQGAADDSVVGTVQKSAAWAVANYLSLAGGTHIQKMDALFPGLFQRSELDGEVVRFQPFES